MGAIWQRPSVEEMRLYLFPRAVHPEFFDSATQQRIDRFGYTLHVALTSVGHLLTWRCGSAVLTEAIASRRQELPHGKFLLRRRFLGVQRGNHPITDGFSYQMSNQVEAHSPELFRHLHNELVHDGRKRGMFHAFPSFRGDLPALGWISVEGCRDTLVIHACHTFPDDLTMLKTQSLIERRA